jgi:hypothetical protein
MSKFRYEVNIVPAEIYHAIKLGERFMQTDGIVIDGVGGMDDDCLILTAHPIDPKASILVELRGGHCDIEIVDG